jgi:outer membrane lipoprotein-sorting protein
MLENTFSDFREAGGLVFPYHIETRVADRPEVLTIAVDTIELNPDLDDEQFQFPG